jgi:hypothetical protein
MHTQRTLILRFLTLLLLLIILSLTARKALASFYFQNQPCTCTSFGYWCGSRVGKTGLIGHCATNTLYYCNELDVGPIPDQCDGYDGFGSGSAKSHLCFEDARGDMCEPFEEPWGALGL